MGCTHQSTSLYRSTMVVAKKQWVTVWVASWTSYFFSWNIIFTWENSWVTKTMVIQTWVFARHFQKLMKWGYHFKENHLRVFVDGDKTGAFKWKSELWKICICHRESDSFLHVRLFYKDQCRCNKWDNETRQYLEELQDLMSQHFPHTQRMSRDHAWVKGLLSAKQTNGY